MAFTICPLTADDAEAVQALLRRSPDGIDAARSRETEVEAGPDLLSSRDPLERPRVRSVFGLLDTDGTLHGICEVVFHRPTPGTAHISGLLVDSSMRGRGLGRLLHDSVVAQLRTDRSVRRLHTSLVAADPRALAITGDTTAVEGTDGSDGSAGLTGPADPAGFWRHLGYRPTMEPDAEPDGTAELLPRSFTRELDPVVAGPRAGLHHLELWTADLVATCPSWHWMLSALGWTAEQVPGWDSGRIWRHRDGSYLVLEQSADTIGRRSERRGPGMNHVALGATDRAHLDALRAAAPAHGWRELFSSRYPHAGGPDHTAWYGEDPEGIEVELVAPAPSTADGQGTATETAAEIDGGEDAQRS